MKKIKTIFTIFLLIITAYTIALSVLFITWQISTIRFYASNPDPDMFEYGISVIIRYSLFAFFSVISTIFSIIMLVYLNPRLFRRSTYTNLSEEWAKNKADREARKAEKAKADKQKRIEELERELDEMRKE